MTEPTACRNIPILRADPTPPIPPRSGYSYGKTYGRKRDPLQPVRGYFDYFSAPVALRGRRRRVRRLARTGHFNGARCWRNWLQLVPLPDTAVTQAVPAERTLCLRLLDPCAQRDGRRAA